MAPPALRFCERSSHDCYDLFRPDPRSKAAIVACEDADVALRCRERMNTGDVMDLEKLFSLVFLASAVMIIRTYVRATAPDDSETTRRHDDASSPDTPKS